MTRGTRSGGVAAARGFDFQHRVAAWFAVRILAEEDGSPWGLGPGSTLDFIRAETEQPVDDLLVGTAEGGFLFVQVKSGVALDAVFASALDQFVRQILANRMSRTTARSWERPLDPQRDRLLLVAKPQSSNTVKVHLSNALRRVGQLTPDQPLDDCARNAGERKAVRFLLERLAKSWTAHTGAAPSPTEIRGLISLLRLQFLDLVDGQADHREASTLLRTVVLKERRKEGAAWAALVSACSQLAAQASGTDRAGLRRLLTDANLLLNVSRTRSQDVERLRLSTQAMCGSLAHLSRLRVPEGDVKITRAAAGELQRLAAEESLVVVGDPGAGKSGVLYEFVTELTGARHDVAFLAADYLAAESLGAMRTELGLEHELVDVLQHWDGSAPGYIVIDALDAARAQPVARTLRQLIRAVLNLRGRWHVVASIRKFDLQYSPELRELFHGEVRTTLQDPLFRGLRHLAVPAFSDAELAEIADLSPSIGRVLTQASASLRALLHIPFNLRLVADLLTSGTSVETLTPVRTQTQLLEKYWDQRVRRNDQRWEGRHRILRHICEQMLTEGLLRVSLGSVVAAGDTGMLHDLLSVGVLVASADDVLAFSHHVLFDYSVARLILRGEEHAVRERLSRDTEFALVIRPSLVLHFRDLWERDRTQFWSLVFGLIEDQGVPQIAKLVGPTTIIDLAETIADLVPLVDLLVRSDESNRGNAEATLGHVVGALLSQSDPVRRLLGSEAGPWLALLERLSAALTNGSAYHTRALLTTVCDSKVAMTLAEQDLVGVTARRLFEHAIDGQDAWLLVHAMQCVCRTFETDSTASTSLLRRLLLPDRIRERGYQELPWLARETKSLVSAAPELVAEIYRAGFQYEETSAEPTSIGASQILALVSNRRQDYDLARYQLAEDYSVFLRRAPQIAIPVLDAVLGRYIEAEHSESQRDPLEESFDFRGVQGRMRADYSFIWDARHSYDHDQAVKILNAFDRVMEEWAQHEAPELAVAVDAVGVGVRWAVVWRRMLQIARRNPASLGALVRELSWASPMLTFDDTTTDAGEFLRVIYPSLTEGERARAETAILQIPSLIPPERARAATGARDRLLACIPPDLLVGIEPRRLVAELTAQNRAPTNDPPATFSSWSGEYSEEEYLRDSGVPVTAPANESIRSREAPVREFAAAYRNAVPDISKVQEVLPAIVRLWEALRQADDVGVHPKQSEHAWGTLAEACGGAVKARDLSCDAEYVVLRTIILEASVHPSPIHNPESAEAFDRSPSWGGPSPRIEAAQAMMLLAQRGGCLNAAVLAAIERLSADSVPAVRLQVAASLALLRRPAPDLMWQIIERMGTHEPRNGVLHWLLVGTFGSLIRIDERRIVDLLVRILARTGPGPGSDEVRATALELIAGAYVGSGNDTCKAVLTEIVAEVSPQAAEVARIVSSLRQAMTYGIEDTSDAPKSAVRHRAQGLFTTIGRAAIHAIRALEAAASQPDGSVPDYAQRIGQLTNTVVIEFLFSSGGTSRRSNDGQDDTLSLEAKRIFYAETREIFDMFSEVGHPALLHRYLETLERFVPVDPDSIFLRIARALSSGARYRYQFESLGIDLVVRLVQRYLTDFPWVFRSRQCRESLSQILDIFIEAGWPAARRLTYELDEVLR